MLNKKFTKQRSDQYLLIYSGEIEEDKLNENL